MQFVPFMTNLVRGLSVHCILNSGASRATRNSHFYLPTKISLLFQDGDHWIAGFYGHSDKALNRGSVDLAPCKTLFSTMSTKQKWRTRIWVSLRSRHKNCNKSFCIFLNTFNNNLFIFQIMTGEIIKITNVGILICFIL